MTYIRKTTAASLFRSKGHKVFGSYKTARAYIVKHNLKAAIVDMPCVCPCTTASTAPHFSCPITTTIWGLR